MPRPRPDSSALPRRPGPLSATGLRPRSGPPGGVVSKGTRAPSGEPLGKDALRDLKVRCNKEIRKPGKKYELVLTMVRSVRHHGERNGLIDDLCKECTRYRMNDLVGLLEKERNGVAKSLQ
eukprot:CAMPEP_0206328036 /NCGR_PEP_ID=MMETSP0106_2-20121207/22467_1 /ASSEMBLY_ACC=CAM_ASM_000206 /TAXON_ID=81532 /ORGANISM="Acanthoeca-like sp., Strain 10tr" /LENGTH=120 /DNA_ID=CAMNT_0053760693 /DNA_START=42 /DNA_END=404 /DNA_ORIENTATION=-